jgi:hypothetical protein
MGRGICWRFIKLAHRGTEARFVAGGRARLQNPVKETSSYRRKVTTIPAVEINVLN